MASKIIELCKSGSIRINEAGVFSLQLMADMSNGNIYAEFIVQLVQFELFLFPCFIECALKCLEIPLIPCSDPFPSCHEQDTGRFLEGSHRP